MSTEASGEHVAEALGVGFAGGELFSALREPRVKFALDWPALRAVRGRAEQEVTGVTGFYGDERPGFTRRSTGSSKMTFIA